MIRLSAAPEALPHARQFIRDQLYALGLGGHVDDALHAANEAVSNAILHAYPQGGGEVEIAVSQNSPGIAIVVRDEGRGFRGSGDTAGAGFGLEIMRALADAVEIESDANAGTQVRLTFLP